MLTERAKLEVCLLAGAVLLGLLGDALLREFPWGANFTVWMAALFVIFLALMRESRECPARGAKWLLLPAVLFSLAFLWRDAPALKLLNILALLATFSLILLQAQGGRVRAAGLIDYVLGAVIACLSSAFGLLPLIFGRAEWKNHVRTRQAAGIVRGILLAIPLLLLFGALFMLADAVFEGIVKTALHINFARLFTHFLVAAFFAWCSGGYLRGTFFGKELKFARETRLSSSFSLGILEVSIVLGLVDLLFLLFVWVQFRYFFGGVSNIHATSGLTYAEYARRGFFELVAVAALVLPLLLVAHWLLVRKGPESEWIFRVLAGIQVSSVFVIMASAFERMRLYLAEYGLTEQRLYPTSFMAWLVVVFVWFAATVLTDHRERFAIGALLAGYVLIAALQILNPDALIARVNLEREKQGRTFDAHYTARLSADALPVIAEALPSLKPEDRCAIGSHLLKRWDSRRPTDWRTWNWSRAHGWRLMLEAPSSLRMAACAQQQK